MIVLMFKNLDIPEGFKHTASDWQISTDKYFRKNTIVKESRNDKKHLTSILFDITLDPDKVYYARARVIMDKGLSDWSDIDIMRTEDLDKIDLDIDIPSVVSKPEIFIDFDPTKVPGTLFKIKTSPLSTNSNSRHASTDYFITDLNGSVVYTSIENTDSLVEHMVSEIELPGDNFYLIKASQKSTSGDISPLGQKLIYVPSAKEIVAKSKLNVDAASKNGMKVELQPVDDIKQVHVDLFMIGAEDPISVYSTVEDKFIFDIPKASFTNPIGTYLLAVQYEYINGNMSPIKYFKVLAS